MGKSIIDINFNFYSDARGGDPDSKSPTLRKYHKFLWSKTLPNGEIFELLDNKYGSYLVNNSKLGDFYLGSDSIVNSYKNHRRKKWLTNQIPNEVNELLNLGSTIGGYVIFPNKQVDGNQSINQSRGTTRLIDDRFDLTLECIRLFYLEKHSPLYDTLSRYRNFFDLFVNFSGYVKFFLLEDLVNENQEIKFYLPFNHFESPPVFSNVEDYLSYKNEVANFIRRRSERINNYEKSISSAYNDLPNKLN